MSEVKSYDMQHACMKEADGGKYVLRKEWEQLRSALREGIETRNLLNEKITTLQRERDELKKQRDELQAIVDKLADVFHFDSVSQDHYEQGGGDEYDLELSDCYGKLADETWKELYKMVRAAEAAKGGEG